VGWNHLGILVDQDVCVDQWRVRVVVKDDHRGLWKQRTDASVTFLPVGIVHVLLDTERNDEAKFRPLGGGIPRSEQQRPAYLVAMAVQTNRGQRHKKESQIQQHQALGKRDVAAPTPHLPLTIHASTAHLLDILWMYVVT
jgi:hypothetical protein